MERMGTNKLIMKLFICAVGVMAMLMYPCDSNKAFAVENYNNSVLMVGSDDDDDDSPYGKSIKLTPAEEYAMKAPGKRAAGKGTSFRESAALQAAETEARTVFATALSSSIISASKRVGFDITQYAGDDATGQTITDGGEKQTSLIKSISQNVISNTTRVKINKYYNSKNRRYTIFVCLEYNGEIEDMVKEATSQLKKKISAEDRAKLENEFKEIEDEVKTDLVNSMTPKDSEPCEQTN